MGSFAARGRGWVALEAAAGWRVFLAASNALLVAALVACGATSGSGSPGPLGPSKPTDVPGLQLWLDASRGVTGSPITGWADQSGHGRDFGGDSTGRPSSGTGINGRASVDFDGVRNNMVALTATAADVVSTAGWTVFAVFRYDGAVPDQAAHVWLYPAVVGETGGFWGVEVNATRFWGYNWDGAEAKVSVASPLGAASLGYARFDGSHLRAWLDGQSAEVPAGPLTDKALRYPVALARAFPSSSYFRGSIGDVAVWNRALDVDELQRVSLFFSQKYGL